MRSFLVLITTMVFLSACASFEARDGTKAWVFGQSQVEYCAVDVEGTRTDKSKDKVTDGEDVADKVADEAMEQAQKLGCLKAKGGALSGGVTDVLGDALKLPGALLRGAAAGLP